MAQAATARRAAAPAYARPARPPQRPGSRARHARARSNGHHSHPGRGRAPAPGPAQLIPVAAGRAAVAVRGLPDSGFVIGITRGRLWIGLLGTLLAGIVALNVISLSLTSSSGRAVGQAATLERQNSGLRAGLAEQLSNDRVQAAAGDIGLYVPQPDEIRYLSATDRDARIAAERLLSGELGTGVSP